MLRAYHFVGKTLRNGRPIPKDGEWLNVKLPLKLCQTGLHASLHVADALNYAPGNTLCLVHLAGQIIEGDDKLCASRRRIVARFDATELLRADARLSALSVIHLWKAPQIVIDYLTTGDETKRIEAQRAADAYAYDAYAYDAAYDAAYAYAYAYAYDAASIAVAAAAASIVAAAAAAADAASIVAAADAASIVVAASDAAADAAAAVAAAADADAAYAAAYADADAADARKASREKSRARLQAAVDAKFKELLS